ncbi:hypothetical protein PQ456_03405 [Paenibacillus kyungheensis]|uniref:Uncharacterized protein n=1 Tax=Paenibacillus kyungheensis TaxID=1452732 RepID=A0AAX3M415_9BACL|nr:hypothetical protein [Paenibacillus kyungheensis]WCT56583.1 hypothetical protein PQ456_03405 [Paenibacillus kyungheensis]
MDSTIWKDFINVLNNPLTTKDYINYYKIITSWIQSHRNNFKSETLSENRLNLLSKLNPDVYVVETPGFLLDNEKKRFEKNEPDNFDNFAMILGNRLWDMVTNRGKECPNCEGDEMRYLITKEENCSEIILECNSCGWTETLNGEKWRRGIIETLPANRKDLQRFNIVLN